MKTLQPLLLATLYAAASAFSQNAETTPATGINALLPDPGLDPTIFHSSIRLSNELVNRDADVSKDTTKLNLTYAFGAERDWNVQLDLPFVTYDAGTLPGAEDASGLGDIEMRVGHVFDGEGVFRWGAGLNMRLNTAEDPALGEGSFRFAPGIACAVQPCREFEFQISSQLDQSLHTDAGVPEVQALKLKPAVKFNLPAACYLYVENELAWDLSNGEKFSSVLKFELGHGFGSHDEWVTSLRYETPLTQSANQHTLTLGIAYVFP